MSDSSSVAGSTATATITTASGSVNVNTIRSKTGFVYHNGKTYSSHAAMMSQEPDFDKWRTVNQGEHEFISLVKVLYWAGAVKKTLAREAVDISNSIVGNANRYIAKKKTRFWEPSFQHRNKPTYNPLNKYQPSMRGKSYKRK
jgi:hypothetical protein